MNGSLILKGDYINKCFAIKKYSSDFEPIKCETYPLYEDSSWKCYSSCHGEWGGFIYFVNKNTKKSYAAPVSCSFIINKIDSIYYVTSYSGTLSASQVIAISNPEKLRKAKLNFRKIPDEGQYGGYRTILDSIMFNIQTSFVFDNNLYHIYTSDRKSFIGYINNGVMVPLYQFGFSFTCSYDGLDKEGNQILSFNIIDMNSNKDQFFHKYSSKGILKINKKHLQFKLIK